MAEFCLECWNRINEANYSEKDYVISEDLDLCEGCGEYKRVIVCARDADYYAAKLFRLSVGIFRTLLHFLGLIVFSPYFIYRRLKRKK